jgi:hypothetical protein
MKYPQSRSSFGKKVRSSPGPKSYFLLLEKSSASVVAIVSMKGEPVAQYILGAEVEKQN